MHITACNINNRQVNERLSIRSPLVPLATIARSKFELGEKHFEMLSSVDVSITTSRKLYQLSPHRIDEGVASMSKYFVDKSECSTHDIFPGVTIQTAACKEMMLSMVEFKPGAVVEEHAHPHEQVGVMIAGEATFYVGDEQRLMKPGDMYRIPGGVKHRVVATDAGAQALDIFHPIRDDYI